ncbi:HPr family phosphocarrier protein [Domibacillus indicus]|uniref:HPr family phosphocarrier protein n=1 Tax=Domibacillus indicus TaxID=1437523 RepID=UPI00203DD2DA|nr:HPr family phosphocarrier protein [Domibacillus indicus]MCM3790245.1 HPr family phosphocarrier protein [Domibacillus indicus]
MSLDKTTAHIVAEINQTASQYKSSIVIITDHKMIDAKSIPGLTYSILSSSSFKLEIHGPDEEKAKLAMASVLWKQSLPVGVV